MAGVDARRCQKKPVVVEAVQWDGSTADGEAIVAWIRGRSGDAHVATVSSETTEDGEQFEVGVDIVTLEGTMRACPYDWVIRGVAGEFYPCKPDIFNATYVAVEP